MSNSQALTSIKAGATGVKLTLSTPLYLSFSKRANAPNIRWQLLVEAAASASQGGFTELASLASCSSQLQEGSNQHRDIVVVARNTVNLHLSVSRVSVHVSDT